MKEIYLTLAVEDILSEVVARKLIEQTQKKYRVTQCLRKGGAGYLKSKINALCAIFPLFLTVFSLQPIHLSSYFL